MLFCGHHHGFVLYWQYGEGQMAFIVLGSTLHVTLVWELADMFNGLMELPNPIAPIALSKVVSLSLNDFDKNFASYSKISNINKRRHTRVRALPALAL